MREKNNKNNNNMGPIKNSKRKTFKSIQLSEYLYLCKREKKRTYDVIIIINMLSASFIVIYIFVNYLFIDSTLPQFASIYDLFSVFFVKAASVRSYIVWPPLRTIPCPFPM